MFFYWMRLPRCFFFNFNYISIYNATQETRKSDSSSTDRASIQSPTSPTRTSTSARNSSSSSTTSTPSEDRKYKKDGWLHTPDVLMYESVAYSAQVRLYVLIWPAWQLVIAWFNPLIARIFTAFRKLEDRALRKGKLVAVLLDTFLRIQDHKNCQIFLDEISHSCQLKN